MILGTLVNVFFILRFAANFYKGSFGFWDQLIEIITLILLPALAMILLGVMASTRFLFQLPDAQRDRQRFFTKSLNWWFRAWSLSAAFFIYLMMLYFAPPLNQLIGWIVGKWTGSGIG